MFVEHCDARADGQRPAGVAAQVLLDAQGGLQGVVPGTDQKDVVAAGVDDADAKPLQQAVDVVLEEQRHLPRERCGAEQIDVLHPLHGVGLVRLLKAGKKGLPQIVHVHAADGDAADALRLVGKILNIVAGGIVADEQVDGRAERPDQPVLGVGAHGVGAEAGVVRERKEPFAAPDARQRKGTGAGRAVDQINRLALDLRRQVGKPIAARAETLGVDLCGIAAHLALPGTVGDGLHTVQGAERSGIVGVLLVLLGNGVDPAEQGLVGACLCGDIAQVVGAAGGPTVGQEQLHAELFVQPAGGGAGQQEIAVPAAAVNDVSPGQAAAVQQLVHVVLHEQFQKERTAAEGPQGTLGMDGVDEPLDAGKVGGVEQERRFPAQLCGSVQQGKGVGLL